MKRINQLIAIGIFAISTMQAQNVTTIKVKPVGVYAEIQVADQNRMIEELYDEKSRNAAVDTIFNNLSRYNPPVLYVFSQALFANGEKNSAVEWYLYAQINAMYDAERCADPTAKQAVLILEENIRSSVGSYMKSKQELEKESAQKVLILFDKLVSIYDIRWINLHGMGAFEGAFDDDKSTDKASKATPKLTEDRLLWPTMRTKVLQQFKDLHGLK